MLLVPISPMSIASLLTMWLGECWQASFYLLFIMHYNKSLILYSAWSGFSLTREVCGHAKTRQQWTTSLLTMWLGEKSSFVHGTHHRRGAALAGVKFLIHYNASREFYMLFQRRRAPDNDSTSQTGGAGRLDSRCLTFRRGGGVYDLHYEVTRK